MAQERFRLLLVLCGGRDGDGKTEDVLRLFVGGLREDDVFLEAERDVAHLVDSRRRDAAEVAHSWENDMDELVEERLHARSAERHLIAREVADAHLEGRDRFLRIAQRGLLAREFCQTVEDELALLLVGDGADADRDDDLLDARRDRKSTPLNSHH